MLSLRDHSADISSTLSLRDHSTDISSILSLRDHSAAIPSSCHCETILPIFPPSCHCETILPIFPPSCHCEERSDEAIRITNQNRIILVIANDALFQLNYTIMTKPSPQRAASFTIHDLPVSERPRERLQRLGVEALSEQEILAVILGRGIAGESVMVTAQRLLSQFGSLKGMAGVSVEELSQVRGIGPAKAAQLKAAFELANRVESYPESGKKLSVKTPDEVVSLVRGRLKGKKKEYFLALLLDTRGQLIKTAEISVGSLDSSIVHPREVFKEAISASAASVIFVHNHPSGDPEPSEDDIKLTKRLAEVGEIMGITVLDHIIIGGKNHLSLKGKGLF